MRLWLEKSNQYREIIMPLRCLILALAVFIVSVLFIRCKTTDAVTNFVILLLLLAGCAPSPHTVSIAYYSPPAGEVPFEITISALSRSPSDSLYTVEGRVRDSVAFDNVVGVTIRIVHSKRRGTTDTAGVFTLEGLRVEDALSFASYGFIRKTVSIREVVDKKTSRW
jgi:hypothetical protein